MGINQLLGLAAHLIIDRHGGSKNKLNKGKESGALENFMGHETVE